MTGGEKLQVLVAVVMGLFGFIMLAGVLAQTLEGTSNHTAKTDILFGFMLGVLPFAAALAIGTSVRSKMAARAAAKREAAVLRIAQGHQWTVTAMDVATEAGMALEDAGKMLDGFSLRGFCEIDVTDAGTTIYRFRP